MANEEHIRKLKKAPILGINGRVVNLFDVLIMDLFHYENPDEEFTIPLIRTCERIFPSICS
jgi:hypothetical protein